MIVLILLSRFAKITTLSTTASSNIQRRQYTHDTMVKKLVRDFNSGKELKYITSDLQ
jgi:hypothetical protein